MADLDLNKLEAALARILPVTITNTPDYAEMTFGEASAKAMTVEPDTFLALNDLPELIALARRDGVEEPVDGSCKSCNAPRPSSPCWKCGGEVKPVAEGWEWPGLTDIGRIRELAREVGYAVGVHGSQQRDQDLIAVPWVESAVTPLELAQHIAAGLGGTVLDYQNQDKPCGRWSCNIHTPEWTKMIDLSVMPAHPAPASAPGDGEQLAKALWDARRVIRAEDSEDDDGPWPPTAGAFGWQEDDAEWERDRCIRSATMALSALRQPDTEAMHSARPADVVDTWPAITDAWVDTYCELTGRDPEGGSVTFIGDGPVSASFRDIARREIDAMLCAAPKAAVRSLGARDTAAAEAACMAGFGEGEGCERSGTFCHLCGYRACMKATPADPRPDPRDEALREAQEKGAALVRAVLEGDKREMLIAADAFNSGYPKRQKALAKIDAVIGGAG